MHTFPSECLKLPLLTSFLDISTELRNSIGRLFLVIYQDLLIDSTIYLSSHPHSPWDTLWWKPFIHLVFFVHRVTDLERGLYFLVRQEKVETTFRSSTREEFLWNPARLFQKSISAEEMLDSLRFVTYI